MSLISEPVRKSVLDVVQHNLQATGNKTYITRVIYFGEYHGTHEVIRKRMENIIQDLRMDYTDITITGLFLVYPAYYVHILETWEDIIYKHYELMYTIKNDEYKFGKAISLPSYHHANRRFFTNWCHFYTISPTLLETLKDYTLDNIQKQVLNCLRKVYILCEYIANAMLEKSDSVQQILQNLGEKITHYLPESTVLEFLLNVKSSVLKTVEEDLQIYCNKLPCVFWDGKRYINI